MIYPMMNLKINVGSTQIIAPVNKSLKAAPKPAARAPSFLPKTSTAKNAIQSPICVYPPVAGFGSLIVNVHTKINAIIKAVLAILFVVSFVIIVSPFLKLVPILSFYCIL